MHPSFCCQQPPEHSAWGWRRSRNLVVIIVFLAHLVDLLLMTAVEPVLPDIVEDSKYGNLSQVIPFKATRVSSAERPHFLGRNIRVTILFAVKPGMEIIGNVAIGYVVDMYGHRTPLILGCVATFLSTLGFAYAPWYWLLCLTRMLQAIGSSMTVISGLAMINTYFTDEKERRHAIALAFDGLVVGLLIGYPAGGITYEYFGRPTPFVIISAIVLIDWLLRCSFVEDAVVNTTHQATMTHNPRILCNLLSDPDVLICCCLSITMNGALGALIVTIPSWFNDEFHADKWNVCIIFGISAFGQILVQTIIGYLPSGAAPKWFLLFTGCSIFGISTALYPLIPSTWFALIPDIVGRVGFGLYMPTVNSFMGDLSDHRFGQQYGAMFGIYTASYNIGFVTIPLLASTITAHFGVGPALTFTGCIVILSAPLALRLRKFEREKDNALAVSQGKPVDVNSTKIVVVEPPDMEEEQVYPAEKFVDVTENIVEETSTPEFVTPLALPSASQQRNHIVVAICISLWQ